MLQDGISVVIIGIRGSLRGGGDFGEQAIGRIVVVRGDDARLSFRQAIPSRVVAVRNVKCIRRCAARASIDRLGHSSRSRGRRWLLRRSSDCRVKFHVRN